MSENKKVLTKEEILRLLTRLDTDLAEHGQKATIYIVGGANIALAVDTTRTTTDIDVVVKRGLSTIVEAARRVAASEPGLGDDWLNAEFTNNQYDSGMTWSWLDNKEVDNPGTVYVGRNLQVELASPEMILALKTLVQRPQDLDDIYKLMRITGIKTPLELGRNLARFTGRRIFDMQGTPGMFLHIDPQFRNIFDNAPSDLRLVEPEKRPPLVRRIRDVINQRRKRRAG